jgi:hypothetical protein
LTLVAVSDTLAAVLASRRDILSLLPLLGSSALNPFARSGDDAEPTAIFEAWAQEAPADRNTFDFWTQDIRNPEAAGARTRGLGAAPRASFVFYDPVKGFLTGSDIGDDGLREAGDIDVIVNVDHVRPSVADQGRFLNLEGASLRIDVQQGHPLPSLSERLAWTAIAGFLPENKKLPELKEMQFNPGTAWGKLQSIPLPEGGGRWTWNFFLQRRKGRWMQLLDMIRRTKGLLMPIFGLGLPAIAITALTTVDAIVAEISKDERTEWLFQSPDIYFYGTRRARDTFEGSKLRLKQGMYVIIPSDKLAAFGKEQNGLTIKDGLIVPKNTTAFEVEAAAKHVIPDITYLTVGVGARYRPVAKS